MILIDSMEPADGAMANNPAADATGTKREHHHAAADRSDRPVDRPRWPAHYRQPAPPHHPQGERAPARL